jgi:murein DD-endopeptidase MepM/ murein hydrolase activator NlpD
MAGLQFGDPPPQLRADGPSPDAGAAPPAVVMSGSRYGSITGPADAPLPAAPEPPQAEAMADGGSDDAGSPRWLSPTGNGVRGVDRRGDGAFGAKRRGSDGEERTHEGVDYIAGPNQNVIAVTDGRITKLGYPYPDNSSYRYVEITTDDGHVVREMYVLPRANMTLNSPVKAGDMIGTSQSLQPLYPGITDHVHLEVRKGEAKQYKDKQLVDPRTLIR